MAKIYIMIYFLISVNRIYEFWYRYEQYKKKPQKTFQEHPQQHLYLQTTKNTFIFQVYEI